MTRLSFYLFMILARFLSILPLRCLYWFSDGLYLLVFYGLRYRKKVVLENLRNAFPEKTEAERAMVCRRFYRHFCDLLVEIIKLLHISDKAINRRMVFSDPAVFDEDYARGKHILMVISHYNNWEWLGTLAPQTSHQLYSIYKPLSNPYFDQLMIHIRTKFGAHVVPMAKVGRLVVDKFKGPQPVIINFLSDQSPVRSEIQYWTSFLNQDTPMYLGVEKLAQKTRQPVYFGYPVKIKRGYYTFEVEKLCDDCAQLSPHQITELHVRALERVIREKPEYWLWSHRRWKIKKEIQP